MTPRPTYIRQVGTSWWDGSEQSGYRVVFCIIGYVGYKFCDFRCLKLIICFWIAAHLRSLAAPSKGGLWPADICRMCSLTKLIIGFLIEFLEELLRGGRQVSPGSGGCLCRLEKLPTRTLQSKGFKATVPKRPSEDAEQYIPSGDGYAKVPERMIPNETSQTKDPKRKFPSERSQAQVF